MTGQTVRSPELALLAQCCSRNFARGPRDALQLPESLDWPGFIALARYHRVQGLAFHALSATDAPDEVIEPLSADARTIAAANLAIAHKCSELSEAFTRARLPLLFLKGLTLGALAYHNPLLKMGWDIDLLIDPADLTAAGKLLTGHGFVRRDPPAPVDLASWHRRSKESTWSSADGLHIELHTRLADNRTLIRSLDVHSLAQQVEIAPGIGLPTLAPEELFAYLCVHGASSAWFRLKWVSDFAGLIHGLTAEEIDRLFNRAQELGAYRAAGQALLLADALFGILAGTALRERLGEDGASRFLAGAALRQLYGRRDGREPTEAPFGTLRIHWTQLLLKPGLGFMLTEAGRQIGDLVHRRAVGA